MITQTPSAATPQAKPPPANSATTRPSGPAAPGKDWLQESRKLQQLVRETEELRDPVARALVHECLHSLLTFYGDGLARLLQVVKGCGPDGQHVFDRLANDPVVRGLLLIHGLHPLDLSARLRQAIEKVRPYMESHGGNVELLGLENDYARLRLQGACRTCPSSAITMELALRRAIEEICPDLMGFDVEGVQPSPNGKPAHPPGKTGSPTPRGWTVLEVLPEVEDGEARALEVTGVPLVLSRVNGNLYAYRNRCPVCMQALKTGCLENGELHCRSGHRYDVQRAGRNADASDRHLDPVPLLVEESVVKIALG